MWTVIKLLHSLSVSFPELAELLRILPVLCNLYKRHLEGGSKMRWLMTIYLLCFSGCETHNYDNAKMLMERSDFPAAVEAVPLWF